MTTAVTAASVAPLAADLRRRRDTAIANALRDLSNVDNDLVADRIASTTYSIAELQRQLEAIDRIGKEQS